MKVPYSWLKEFVDIQVSPQEVADRLNETGIEAVAYPFGERIENIVVGKILSVGKHPERDKLLVCKVSDGEREYQIITGATNVFPNGKVVLAKEGAVIQGKTIKPVKFGSLQSEGMLLSLEELGIGEDAEGILILPDEVKEGEDPNKLLGLGEDWIIEIEITPNRGDALSVKGLAREVGAVFGLKKRDKKPSVEIPQDDSIKIQVLTDKAYRYRGVIIQGVEIKPSPFDIQLKLIKAGQKPINNVVDITNYILLEEGQPLHAFDLDKIEGEVVVREAKEGEKVITLDGEERSLKQGDIVIADSKKVIAIAGIIGADNTKVDSNTRNILLEGAVFDNIQVRKTAKRLGITTESSYRFERGVDIQNLPNAQDRAVELILQTATGKATGYKDIYTKPYIPKEITLREKTTKRVLGIDIPKEEAKELLERLEIPTEITEGGTVSKIPAFRSLDLEREIDLVEEVGRLKGLNKLSETYPKIPTQAFRKSDEFNFDRRTRDFFKDIGFDEVVSYTFVDEEIYSILGLPVPPIRIKNYLLKIQSIMRDNLAVSLIKTLQYNLRFQNRDLKIFEISSTFFEDYEEIRLGLLATGKINRGFDFTKGETQYSTTQNWDFLKIKGAVESYLKMLGLDGVKYTQIDLPYINPYEGAKVSVNGVEVGYVGRIHPEKAEMLEIPKDTYIAELKLRCVGRTLNNQECGSDYLFNLWKNKDTVVFQELPKFPAVKRSLAFEVDEDLQVDKLLEAVKNFSPKIEAVELFDIYYLDENRKSVAVSVLFRDKEKSLSDEEVNQLVEQLVKDLQNRFNLKLRT
ncbi:MAG: phenylalanine--tRNA ligase subunit beta [Aquificae bacterium]|nr:phenylalanine--tRNA ligase subunit beta [Aquificota bacterium]